jgi:hypothetical protein
MRGSSVLASETKCWESKLQHLWAALHSRWAASAIRRGDIQRDAGFSLIPYLLRKQWGWDQVSPPAWLAWSWASAIPIAAAGGIQEAMYAVSAATECSIPSHVITRDNSGSIELCVAVLPAVQEFPQLRCSAGTYKLSRSHSPFLLPCFQVFLTPFWVRQL